MPLKSRTPSAIYPLKVRIQFWIDAGKVCYYCDKPLAKPGTKAGKATHMDHKIAQSKGGSDELENLVLCCKVCNREKGKADYDVFLERRREAARKQVLRLSKLLAQLRTK